MSSPASYAELDAWTLNFEVEDIILDAELTRCLVGDLIELCRPSYSAADLACLNWIRKTPEPWAPSDERTAMMAPIWAKRSSINRSEAARAEFLHYAASNMPLDFQYAGYLILFSQHAGIPFDDAVTAFRRYIPPLG